MEMMGHSCKPLLAFIFLYSVIGLLDSHVTRRGPSSGMCKHYSGICSSRLNSSEHRYINSSLGMSETERVAVALLKAVQSIYEDQGKDQTCKEILEQTSCFFVLPFCSSQEKRLEYCREDCLHLFDKCGGDLNQIVGAGKFIFRGTLSRAVFRFDECTDLPTSAETTSGNITCKHLPFIAIPRPPRKMASPVLAMNVIIVIAVSVPLTVFLLVLCGLHLRRNRRNAKLHSIQYENGKEDSGVNHDRLSNVVSMRDRIREWKVAPSELTELVDICKSRGVLEIPVDNIEYLKDLGAGQYGLVFQGRMNEAIEGETSRIVAVKTLREGSSEDAIKDFCQEVNIMSTFSHPNVVKLIGVSLAGEPYCMIFEFVEFGDLASFLRNCDDTAGDANLGYPKLSVTDQLAMSVQIASGMKYISSIRCVHRDLAARNCLVGRGLVVKISDFGLSRDVYTSEYYRMDKTRMLPVRWLPPEAFVDGRFTTHSDVYSYGVLLWEIFTFATLPYADHDNKRVMELILEGVLLPKPDTCPASVYDIMHKCWHSNPDKRISFPEIINELCSLDNLGRRFEAREDQIHENFKARAHSNASKMADEQSLGFNNKTCIVSEEPPINVERLPPPPITKMSAGHYDTPPAKRRGYDGVVALPIIANSQRASGRGEFETPRAVHSFTPPPDCPSSYRDDDAGSAPIYGNVDASDDDDPEGPQETYDVPEETYSVPAIPPHGFRGTPTQEIYDVPPVSKDIPDGPEETYDVPPRQEDESPKAQMYSYEPKKTYDVPHGSMNRLLKDSEGMNRDNDEEQDTYDVPPKQEVDDGDEIYENSLQVTPKTAHYSVPRSPFLNRRNDKKESECSSLPSKNVKHSYVNVDFDGFPLLTS